MPQTQTIGEVRQIRALASPVRQDIVDTVAAIGPCTVAALAAALGRAADGLYYHIRLLQRVGLLVEKQTRGPGRRTEALLELPFRPLAIRYDPGLPANRRAVTGVARAMTRAAVRDFERSFASEGVRAAGARRNLWAARAQGLLSARDLEHLNIVLGKLLDLLLARRRRPVGGSTLHQVTFLLSPVAPSRRSPAANQTTTRSRRASRGSTHRRIAHR